MSRIGSIAMVALLMCGTPAICGTPAFGSSLSLPSFLSFLSSYPFAVDPLRTRPAALEKGLILPGDRSPISCSMPKDFSHPLALGEAVDIALCNNPEIKSSWANIKIQAGALGEARSAYLPTVNGTLNQTHDRIHYPGSDINTTDLDRTTFQGGLSWRVFDFGGRAANHRAAENSLTAALASHNSTLQRALAAVTQAYFDAMTANAALKATTEGEEIAGATLASAKFREERGALSQSDRLRATTALANAVLDHNRAHGDYQKALAVLGQILGVPANTAILLPEDMSANAEEMGRDLKSWLEDAEKNHPAIIAARTQVEVAKDQVKVVRAVGLPSVSFSANYYSNTAPGQAVTATRAREYTLGIGVSIPLFDGFSNTYKFRGAQAQVEQRKAQLADTENRIALELIKAYVDTTYALQNLDASANLLKAAQEALEVSRRRYDKGAADITEILSTQSNVSIAQHERVRCMAEWHSARLRLLANAGQMGRSAVQNVMGTALESTPTP